MAKTKTATAVAQVSKKLVVSKKDLVAQKKAGIFYDHLTKNYEGQEIRVVLHCPDTPIFQTDNGSARMVFNNLNRHIGFKDMVSHIKTIGQLAPDEVFSLEWINGQEKLSYSWTGDKFAPGTNKILKDAVKYSKHLDATGKMKQESELLEAGYGDDVKGKFSIVVAQFLARQSLAEALPMIEFLEKLPKNEKAKVSFFTGQLLVGFLEDQKSKLQEIEDNSDF